MSNFAPSSFRPFFLCRERETQTDGHQRRTEWRKVICKTAAAAAVLGLGPSKRTKRSKRIRNALAPHREGRRDDFGFLSTYGNVGYNRFPLSLSKLQIRRRTKRIPSWDVSRNLSKEGGRRDAKDRTAAAIAFEHLCGVALSGTIFALHELCKNILDILESWVC